MTTLVVIMLGGKGYYWEAVEVLSITVNANRERVAGTGRGLRILVT